MNDPTQAPVRYQTAPVEVEAMRFDGTEDGARRLVQALAPDSLNIRAHELDGAPVVQVSQPHADFYAKEGDWVVRNDRNFYVYTDERFCLDFQRPDTTVAMSVSIDEAKLQGLVKEEAARISEQLEGMREVRLELDAASMREGSGLEGWHVDGHDQWGRHVERENVMGHYLSVDRSEGSRKAPARWWWRVSAWSEEHDDIGDVIVNGICDLPREAMRMAEGALLTLTETTPKS